MNPDERELLRAVAAGQTARQAADEIGMPPNRARYLCEKWAKKAWYDYGVAYDLGWLTDKGKRINEDQP